MVEPTSFFVVSDSFIYNWFVSNELVLQTRDISVLYQYFVVCIFGTKSVLSCCNFKAGAVYIYCNV